MTTSSNNPDNLLYIIAGLLFTLAMLATMLGDGNKGLLDLL
jgi:hypothetical protein